MSYRLALLAAVAAAMVAAAAAGPASADFCQDYSSLSEPYGGWSYWTASTKTPANVAFVGDRTGYAACAGTCTGIPSTPVDVWHSRRDICVLPADTRNNSILPGNLNSRYVCSGETDRKMADGVYNLTIVDSSNLSKVLGNVRLFKTAPTMLHMTLELEGDASTQSFFDFVPMAPKFVTDPPQYAIAIALTNRLGSSEFDSNTWSPVLQYINYWPSNSDAGLYTCLTMTWDLTKVCDPATSYYQLDQSTGVNFGCKCRVPGTDCRPIDMSKAPTLYFRVDARVQTYDCNGNVNILRGISFNSSEFTDTTSIIRYKPTECINSPPPPPPPSPSPPPGTPPPPTPPTPPPPPQALVISINSKGKFYNDIDDCVRLRAVVSGYSLFFNQETELPCYVRGRTTAPIESTIYLEIPYPHQATTTELLAGGGVSGQGVDDNMEGFYKLYLTNISSSTAYRVLWSRMMIDLKAPCGSATVARVSAEAFFVPGDDSSASTPGSYFQSLNLPAAFTVTDANLPALVCRSPPPSPSPPPPSPPSPSPPPSPRPPSPPPPPPPPSPRPPPSPPPNPPPTYQTYLRIIANFVNTPGSPDPCAVARATIDGFLLRGIPDEELSPGSFTCTQTSNSAVAVAPSLNPQNSLRFVQNLRNSVAETFSLLGPIMPPCSYYEAVAGGLDAYRIDGQVRPELVCPTPPATRPSPVPGVSPSPSPAPSVDMTITVVLSDENNNDLQSRCKNLTSTVTKRYTKTLRALKVKKPARFVTFGDCFRSSASRRIYRVFTLTYPVAAANSIDEVKKIYLGTANVKTLVKAANIPCGSLVDIEIAGELVSFSPADSAFLRCRRRRRGG